MFPTKTVVMGTTVWAPFPLGGTFKGCGAGAGADGANS